MLIPFVINFDQGEKMLGKEILGYHVDEKIGSGGFGTVYKVSKTNVSGTYIRALKHIELPTKKQYFNILTSMGGDHTKADDYFSNVLQDIVREIKILSSLSESGNKNIVRYYENDIVENASPRTYDVYILMEYLTPFTDYLINSTLSVKDVIKLGKDVLNALIDCHSKNIIHRDIKDDNIFVAPNGTYKVGDFGVSKVLTDQSRAASIKGTPNFIAPEVYLGKDNYDHTVDIYSLGIVLYRLLNHLRNPFLPVFPKTYTTEDENAAFEARMTGKVPELPDIAKNELGEAVLKAIKPRADRYNSAKEFLRALETAEKNLTLEELSQSIGGCNITAADSLESGDTDKLTMPIVSDVFDVNKKDVESPDLDATVNLRNLNGQYGNRPKTALQENDPDKTVSVKKNQVENNQEINTDNSYEKDKLPENDKKKNNRHVKIAVATAVLLLSILLCVIFIASKNNSDNDSNETNEADNTVVDTSNGTLDNAEGSETVKSSDTPALDVVEDKVYVLFPAKVYSKADVASDVLGTVEFGTMLSRSQNDGKWSMISYQKDGLPVTGYVANDVVTTNLKSVAFEVMQNDVGDSVIASIKSSNGSDNVVVRKYPFAEGYPNDFNVISREEFDANSVIAQIPNGMTDVTVMLVSKDGVWAYVRGMGKAYSNGSYVDELTEVEGYILYSDLDFSKIS